jgi:hypothetical protein
VFFSGFAGLGYEIVWTRMLSLARLFATAASQSSAVGSVEASACGASAPSGDP